MFSLLTSVQPRLVLSNHAWFCYRFILDSRRNMAQMLVKQVINKTQIVCGNATEPAERFSLLLVEPSFSFCISFFFQKKRLPFKFPHDWPVFCCHDLLPHRIHRLFSVWGAKFSWRNTSTNREPAFHKKGLYFTQKSPHWIQFHSQGTDCLLQYSGGSHGGRVGLEHTRGFGLQNTGGESKAQAQISTG